MNRTEKQISRAVERALETVMPKAVEQAFGVLSLEDIRQMSFDDLADREVV